MSSTGEARSSERRVDGRQTKALVRAFLVMSVRKMPMRGGQRGAMTGGLRGVWFLLGIYTLLGGALAMLTALLPRVFDAAFTVHFMTLFLVGSSAMSEASEVLFSASENDVLLHRPIHPSTLVLAKGLTIIAFTSLIALSLNLFPTFALLAVDGARPWVPLVHLASVATETVFASAFVVCTYGAVAKLLGRERFQRMVTGAQIASTLFLAFGFQIVPRMLGRFQVFELANEPGWMWALPPTWFAAIDATLASTDAPSLAIWPAAFGVALTVVLSWIAVLRLPVTTHGMAAMAEEKKPVAVAPTRVARAPSFLSKLLDLWMRDPVERASFRLATAYILRERAIKVRLAAALSFYAVLPLISFLNERENDFMPLMLLWMCSVVPFTVLESLRISSHPAAADVFAVTPVRDPSRIFHGVRKAAMALVQIPLLVYVAAVGAWATRATPERFVLALPPLVALPTFSLLVGVAGPYLPLSIAQRTGQRSLQMFLVFGTMAVAIVLGVITFAAWKVGWFWPTLAGEVVVMAVVHALLVRLIAARVRPAGARASPAVEPGWSS